MASRRTEVTELATAVGMLGFLSPMQALERKPKALTEVEELTWERFVESADQPQFRIDFAGAYRNGQVFMAAEDGLRGRPPLIIEWKGSHRSPGQEQLPVDLRVDHVYLVSCKYASKILLNASASSLFGANTEIRDWYDHVAPKEHQALYGAVRNELGLTKFLPPFVGDIARHHRDELKKGLANRDWSQACSDAYSQLVDAVGRATAVIWRQSLRSKRQKEAMLWRMLRIGSAPYFVLGSSRDRSIRLRVTTPWDWRRRFEFRDIEIWGGAAGQPTVFWRATVKDHLSSTDLAVDGHIEIRWSHGRFAQPPEAKVYLDTPHGDVPGYLHLSGTTSEQLTL